MPSAPQPVRVSLYSSSASRVTEGVAHVVTHTAREAFFRGGRIALKVAGIIIGGALPFVILEPFLAQIWGGVLAFVVFVVVGPILHFRFAQERRTFTHVDGECPACGGSKVLKPYVSAEFRDTFTVLCPACGQTCTAEAVP